MPRIPTKLPPGAGQSPRSWSSSDSSDYSDTDSSSHSSDDEDVGSMSPRREPDPKRRRVEPTNSCNNTSRSSQASPGGLLQPEQPTVHETRQSPTPGFPQGRTYLPSNQASSLPTELPMHLMHLLESLAFPIASADVPGSPERPGTQLEEASPIPVSPAPELQLEWNPENAYEDNGAFVAGPAPAASAIADLRDAVLKVIGADGWLDEDNRASLEHQLGLEASRQTDLKLVATAADMFRRRQIAGLEPTDDFERQFDDAIEYLGHAALMNPPIACALDEFTNARPALPYAAQLCIGLYNDWHDGDEDVPHISTFLEIAPIIMDVAEKLTIPEASAESSTDVGESGALPFTNNELGHATEDAPTLGTEDDNESNQTGSASSEDDGQDEALSAVCQALNNLYYVAGRTIVDYCIPGGFLTPAQREQPPAPPQ